MAEANKIRKWPVAQRAADMETEKKDEALRKNLDAYRKEKK